MLLGSIFLYKIEVTQLRVVLGVRWTYVKVQAGLDVPLLWTSLSFPGMCWADSFQEADAFVTVAASFKS